MERVRVRPVSQVASHRARSNAPINSHWCSEAPAKFLACEEGSSERPDELETSLGAVGGQDGGQQIVGLCGL